VDRYYRFRGKRKLVNGMESLGFKAEYDLWVHGDTKRDVIVFERKLGGIEIRIVCPAGYRNCYADIVLPLAKRVLPGEARRLIDALESEVRGGRG
jgi:hypothetical protein